MHDRTEGLLLHAIPYLGNNRILKVLSPTEGLLSFMAKNKQAALTTPFLWAEWVYKKTSREIYPLEEGSLIDDFSALKQDYQRLSAAGQMAQDVLRTQLPGKNGRVALELILACFRKLPLFPEPAVLASAFRLKLLSAEGLLHIQEQCAQCEEAMSHVFGGECFCLRHAPPASLFLSIPEQKLIQLLSASRSFAELAQTRSDAGVRKKIDLLFEERMGH